VRLRIGVALLCVLVLVALGAPLAMPVGPTEMRFTQALVGPSLEHPLGTDQFGRDVLVRLAVGLRTTILYALVAVAAATALGGAVGVVAGTFGGWWETLLMRPLEVLMAFPVVLLAITVIAALGTGTLALMIAVTAVYTPIVARIARAAALKVRQQEYVQAAEALGAGRARIVLRHVVPNSLGPVITQATVLLGLAILLEAALSFLGLGVQPPAPSLGLMLAEGRQFMTDAVWVVAFPTLAIVLLVMAFNLIGTHLGRSRREA
jgi:peptide/nickel transport system permease protein